MNTMEAGVRKMFPNGEIKQQYRPGMFDVNNLEKGTVPLGAIYNRCQSRFEKTDRREWFVVQVDEFTYLLRMCTAMAGCGYDEFAVVHETAYNSNVKAVNELYGMFYRQTRPIK